MKLQEIFNQLTYGELSQLGIGGASAGGVQPANYNKLIAHINLGLTALHKRFPLKENRLTIELVQGRTSYPLLSKFAVSSRLSKEPVRFIKDSTAVPFVDDILKVEKVFTDAGFELGLNDEGDRYALATPTSTTLDVPADIVARTMDMPDEYKTLRLKVVYRANHPIILTDEGDIDPEETEVELPYTHLEPLLLFVAARVHTPTGMTNETNMGNTYYARYEASCQQIEMQNLRVDQGGQVDKLHAKGFV